MASPFSTWEQFKTDVSATARSNRRRLYRGQSNHTWGLVTSYHRAASRVQPEVYWALLDYVHDQVLTWTDRRWDLKDQTELGAFLGFLQHNGFPTPLLDWTYSPFIAAYFAFEGVDDDNPASDGVAVFALDFVSYGSDWQQVTDFRSSTEHVSILISPSRGNKKQIIQQGAYTLTNVQDQEQHFYHLAARWEAEKKQPRAYLTKYTFSVHEKPHVMRELEMMGIGPMSLFPGIESVCRHLKNQVFPVNKLGMTPSEKSEAFMEALKSLQRKGPQIDLGLGPLPEPK